MVTLHKLTVDSNIGMALSVLGDEDFLPVISGRVTDALSTTTTWWAGRVISMVCNHFSLIQ